MVSVTDSKVRGGELTSRYSDPDSLSDGDQMHPVVHVEGVATGSPPSRHGMERSGTVIPTVVHLTPNSTRGISARVGGRGDRGLEEAAGCAEMQVRVHIDQTTVVAREDDHAPLPKSEFLF